MGAPNQDDHATFRFPGFMSEGRCFLRVIENNKKYIFICAQLKDYYGTSITNAIEQIAQKAAKMVLPHKINPRELIKFIRKAIWIEHYPSGTGLVTNSSYAIVSFDENLNPSWSYASLEEISNQIGIEKAFLIIPDNKHD